MKRIFIQLVLILVAFSAFAQKKEAKAPDNWFNLDPKKNKVNGIGTERAYSELLKNKKSNTVIVAVIDGGTDIYHEDLKDIIWTNEDEIPNNGIDDDHNGYIDDIHGWNFIGGHNPDSNVKEDTYELTRLYAHLNSLYGKVDKSKVSPQKKTEYEKYERVKKVYEEEKERYTKGMHRISEIAKGVEAVLTKIGKQEPTVGEVENFKPTNDREEKGRAALLSALTKSIKIEMTNVKPDISFIITMSVLSQTGTADSCKKMLSSFIEYYSKYLNYHLNTDFDTRKTVVLDNYDKINDISYGNNNVKGPSAGHGSHVAGIIAAMRNNNIGIKGVADNVRIMVLRVVPDGDERDKDVANAIRYAADNGAKVINMSFGKAWSWNKKAVDEAAKYASDKDVLLVHAAGNDNKDLEKFYNYPSDQFEGTEDVIPNWIEVGASSWMKGKLVPASFSNYGMEAVDLFAPGVDIYSTVPDTNKYDSYDGTSMAAPVTAGAAALIRSYYPNLTATQVKEILMKSVTPVKGKVKMPGKKDKVKMKMLCKTGGIVNVYNALILAETYK
ncbi:MAG: S8 family serine peptidase [Bacteroidia bacterium]|nr:S8 family serine peptidase [Bacteroidia bacterium]